ncbi:hypothetical protein AWH48_11295 [Domibacillus aminovorans]|uniref:BIG2 domain-containing protein n=1 Tax=Domibacillus aminovorans TaxID=29332 RepID=A0A177KKC7_9BACI|nr:S8 family serine peptidase [Domibacillus aminovorans]OAH53850.1 hypothetical protein AWH48_11295 [Domibacillus aminovorans]
MNVSRITKFILVFFLIFSSILFTEAKGATIDPKVSDHENKLAKEKERQILIQYKKSSKESAYATKKKSFSTMISKVESIDPLIEILTVKNKDNVDTLVKELKNDSSVQAVEKNRISYIKAQSNDPYISKQWWLDTVNVNPAWAQTKKQQKQIVTAVIDSGIDTYHSDLKNKIAAGGYDFINGTQVISDPNGHGTSVSGVIAAQANNATGIAGVTGSYNVKILPLRVANAKGETYLSDLVEAIDYAINKKVDIINLSLGSDTPSAIENTAIQRAVKAGIIVVAAAGNEALKGNPIEYPASYENVISVGAVNNKKTRASFSSYNSYVDVTAPGEGVYTAAPFQRYEYVNGTSFSTPITAGILSIAKAIKPNLTVNEASNLIKSTSDDLGQKGYDSQYGYGLINAGRIVTTLLSENKRAVTGVQLDKRTINLSFASSVKAASNTLEIQKQQMNKDKTKSKPVPPETIRRTKEVSQYESELNDKLSSANTISLNSYVYGSITGNYLDKDHYRFIVTQPGTLSINSIWVSDYVAELGFEDDLEVGLLDKNGKLITYADYVLFQDKTASRYLTKYIAAGTYYIIVFQSSDYKNLYTDEWYGLSVAFQADNSTTLPALTNKNLFLKKGQSSSLLTAGSSTTGIQWSSSNPVAATVDKNGKVTGKGYGKTIISATANGKTLTCVVKVTADTIRPTASLFETILPADASNQKVTWKSSNTAVATVDQYGIITAQKNGTAIVTVTTAEGNFRASSTVNVTGAKTK